MTMAEPETVAELRRFAGENMALESRVIEAQEAQSVIDYIDTLKAQRDRWRAYASHRETCPDCTVPHGPCAIGCELLAATEKRIAPLRVERSREWWMRRIGRERDEDDPTTGH